MKRSSGAVLALAVVVHLGLLIGWRWQGPLVPFFFDATVLDGRRGLDFYSIYQAGYNARHGWDVYEGDATKVEIVVPYFTPYRYLPIVAYTVGAALSLFAHLTAFKLWVVVVELTLFLCVYITHRLVPDRDLFVRLAAMWLVFTPFYLELFMGQFSFVQGALVFGMLALTLQPPGDRRAAPTQGWALGGLWLASILWKINTVVLVPVFLRLRQWRALIVAGSVVLVLTAPYFFIFPAHLRDFLLNNLGSTVASHELGNLGLRQFIFELLAAMGAPAAIQRAAQFAVVAAVLGISLLVTFLPGRTPDTGHRTWDLGLRTSDLISLWLTAFFLASPQIWEHHYVMLVPVLVVAYWQRPTRLVSLVWLLLALPTPFGFVGLQPVIAANHDLRAFGLEPVWQPLLQHASKALPALLLFGYLVWAASGGRLTTGH